MTGITSQRWQKGLCIKCGKQKEHGNYTMWCKDCTEIEHQTHTAACAHES